MFHAGQQFGNYTLIQQLGCGGFGEVWLAERRTRLLTTQVAVKLPLDELVDHAAIEQEAQLWARASGHANVLPIIEANEYDGQIIIVSEYAADGSLEGLLKRSGGILTVKQAVEMTIGILKGLEFLHSRQIIHRDIKPGNILLQGDTPRLADFGISRVIKTDSYATNAVGTPYYMAPEAFERKRNAQTDVWAVGVMLYQLVKGELPFVGDNITDLFGAIMTTEPAPLPDSIPLKLQEIAWKALSKDVAERYQTARAMRDELDKFWIKLSQSVSAQSQGPTASKKVDDQPTVRISVPPHEANKQYGKINSPHTAPNISSGLPSPAPSVPNIRNGDLPTVIVKPNRHYVALPAVVLLFVVITGVSYWLIRKPVGSTAANNNTNTSPVNISSPSANDPPLIPFRKGDKFGFSDVNKNLLIEAKYDAASPFSEGMAQVKSHGKYGFIDKTGKEITPLKYDNAYPFNDGEAKVKLHGKHGFVDKAGNEIAPLKYDDVHPFNEGLAQVQLNGKDGFIDKTGKEVTPLKYDSANSFNSGLAQVRLNDKEGFIDKTGKEVIPLKYDSSSSFSEGLAIVMLNGKWRIIDKTGKEVTPLKYDSANSFNSGLARVQLNSKYGFIDKAGNEVIPLKYDYADRFPGGLAKVQLNGKEFYIDKNGTEYYEP